MNPPPKVNRMSLLPVAATETILLVDDTPLVLQAVSLVLKKAGFTVLSAACGFRAKVKRIPGRT
jgi:hypothetical protein